MGTGAYYPDYAAAAGQEEVVLQAYSPRLFGAPQQLTNACDIRVMTAKGNVPGAVGDMYLQKILKDAQIANFVVGKALFTGGNAKFGDAIRTVAQYTTAIKAYNASSAAESITATSASSITKATVNNAMNVDAGMIGPSPLEIPSSDDVMYEVEDEVKSGLHGLPEGIAAALLSSFAAGQPWYTFEADWDTYIQRVKTMIKTASVMLGLDNAWVKVGPTNKDYLKAGDPETWNRYRFITVSDGGDHTYNEIASMSGKTNQYISFMIEPNNGQEQYTNSYDSSKFENIVSSGNDIGNELAFMTNSTAGTFDDKVIDLIKSSENIVGSIMSNMAGTVGRFSAAILGGLSRSFLGEHTVIPRVHSRSEATSSFSISINLNASGGDPYSYFIDILVPLFYLLGMALPNQAKNNGAAYTYPPLIQLSVPGMYGVRLGAIESMTVQKKNISTRGYPLSVSVSLSIADLYHALYASPIDVPASFLNNHTLFDYIAQSCGVDKYRPNGTIRILSKVALIDNFGNHLGKYVGDAIMSDLTGLVNKITGIYRM